MGKARPDMEGKVTFFDFFKVVQHYCGPGRFSGSQVKFVFKEQARGLERADPYTLEGAYMSVQDFKATFYPARRWARQYDQDSEERRRLDRRGWDDRSSVTSQSAKISTVMGGPTPAERYAARD